MTYADVEIQRARDRLAHLMCKYRRQVKSAGLRRTHPHSRLASRMLAREAYVTKGEMMKAAQHLDDLTEAYNK